MTGSQMKAARALLGWSPTVLAKLSSQPVRLILMVEEALKPPEVSARRLQRIRTVLEDAGVEFDPANGDVVRLKI